MAESSASAKPRKNGPGRPFQPGQSGNPGGRPKIPEEFRELARKNSFLALEVAVEILRSTKARPGERLRAAEIILDRAWGKPVQATEITGKDGGPIEIRALSDEELDARIAQLSANLGDLDRIKAELTEEEGARDAEKG